ncbi:MAG: PcfJ domain-containing protein [Methyloligellaceae bacterium]
MLSFPGLLFALATDFGTEDARYMAYEKIYAGENLKNASESLSLPWWMRKLPPQAFETPLEGKLPDSEIFSKHIVNLIPEQEYDLPVWLRKVIRSYQLCDESFALWVAGIPLLYTRAHEVCESDDTLELLAAWAWYSQNTDTDAHQLIQTLWHPNMGIHKALDAAKTWYNRAKLVLFIGESGIQDCWLEGDRINGFDIVPLRTAQDFITESQLMNNCLDQYADQIRFHRVRVFSVRREGTPIANIEIGPHEDDRTMPSIEQVRGPKNRRVNPLIWQLAYNWMGKQNFSSRQNGPNWPRITTPANAHPLWQPFQQALHNAGIYTQDLSIFNLDKTEKLLLQLEDLAQIGND